MSDPIDIIRAVGDLVLLCYVGGDPNRAVVVGRLYSEKINPPLHKERSGTCLPPPTG